MALKRIGVLTGGGDAPGLNPAIRALTWKAQELGIETVGIYDGWKGLLDGFCDETWALDIETVRYWDLEGGTRLGSSRTNPFKEDGPGVDGAMGQAAHAHIGEEVDCRVGEDGEAVGGQGGSLLCG